MLQRLAKVNRGATAETSKSVSNNDASGKTVSTTAQLNKRISTSFRDRNKLFVGCAILCCIAINYYLLYTSDEQQWKRYVIHQEQKLFGNSNHTVPIVHLEPLQRVFDRTYYTIRMNTFARPRQLKLSLTHYLTCDGATQIQIVWCIAQGEPPVWLLDLLALHPHRLVLERHAVNSLNERFRILSNTTTTTLAILSIDDDILHPCIALDHAFDLWTQSPSSMVGFDPRAMIVPQQHQQHEQQHALWRYALTGETLRVNGYGIVLTKAAVVHRDYLQAYTTTPLVQHAVHPLVDSAMNCEDIAVSLFVTALDGAQAPIVVDGWAQERTLVALSSGNGISATRNSHLRQRSWCLDGLTRVFGLHASYRNHVLFFHVDDHDGAQGEKNRQPTLPHFAVGRRPPSNTEQPVPRIAETRRIIQRWKTLPEEELEEELQDMIQTMAEPAFAENLITLKDNRWLVHPTNYTKKKKKKDA